MLCLHDYADSGNGYKIRLLLSLLDVPARVVEHDILAGETRTPAFLAMHPNGRVPVLELEDGTCLAESNAILCYLAEDTPYLPADRLARARVLQWLFFEQYSHEPYIATSRYLLRHTPEGPERAAALADRRGRGLAALGVMEGHLAAQEYFVAARYTVADIALYAYTHLAPQGGFPLDDYTAVCAWLDRIAAKSGHVPMAVP